MPKIIVVSTHVSLDNRISKFLKTITTTGYEVLYINSHDDDGVLNIEGVNHLNLKESFNKKNLKGVITTLWKMGKLIEKNSEAYFLHIHDPLLLPISSKAKKMGMKVIFDRHESYDLINDFNGKVSHAMEKLFKKNIDAVVHVNDVQGKYLKENGYKNIVKVPNYQSKAVYDEIKKNTIEGGVENGVKIVYFGGINDNSRDCTKMLDAAYKVLKSNSNIQFELGGSIDGNSLKQKIEKMQKMCPNFKYYGVMNYSEVVEHTVTADVGMYLQKEMPNNMGSSPNKIYEYMIAGLAICAQGRFEDWDKINEAAGKVFSFDSTVDDVAMVLDKMCNDNQYLDACKKKSLALSSNYTWELVEKRYVELYKTLEGSANECI